MPTPAENFSASCEAIKDSIATIVSGAAPLALILKRLIYDPDKDFFAGLIKSPTDQKSDGTERIHAIDIHYAGNSQDENAPIACVDRVLAFDVWFFYELEIGTDANNSEKRLHKEVAEAVWALAASTHLGMDSHADENIRGCVKNHKGLTVPEFRLLPLGNLTAHFWPGRFEVRMQSRYVRV